VRVILTYLTYRSAATQWKKLPSSYIWALFCPPPVGANQIPTDRHCFFRHAFYEQSLATDPPSTADETPLILYLHIAYSPARFGSLDALAGRSTENEAFHMRWQCMILGIRWYDFVRNTKLIATTSLLSVQDIISKSRNSLFGHVVRLDDHTPAHRALSQVAAVRTGSRLNSAWRRLPGRPRYSWIQQIGDGLTVPLSASALNGPGPPVVGIPG